MEYYTLDDIDAIKFNGFPEIEIDTKTMNLINDISKLVGSPFYNKLPNFNNNKRSDKSKKHKNKKHSTHGNIETDVWSLVRADHKITDYKKTVEGINEDIANLKSILNKLTKNNYDDIHSLIIENVGTIELDNIENKNKINEFFVNMGIKNDYYSDIYAKIYLSVNEKYSLYNELLINKFIGLYNKIEPLPNSVDDYDEFCVVSSNNEKRKSFYKFLSNLYVLGIVDYSIIYKCLDDLLFIFKESMVNKDERYICNEIAECLYIIISIIYDDISDDYDFNENILECIDELSVLSRKQFKGLTSQSVFKLKDIIDFTNS
jgi:hypothetical protein